MRFIRRSLLGLFLLSVTLGLLAFAGQSLRNAVEARRAGQEAPQAARERVFSANVVTVTPGQLTPVLQTFGEVRSRRTLELRAPQAGTVRELAEGFEDGAEVTEGQLLLRLDPADATAALEIVQSDVTRAEAEARDAARSLALGQDELAAAEAQVALREQALTRQRNLAERGVGSEAAVETAALAVSAAEQALLARRQSLAQAEARVDQAATALARQKIALAEAERSLAETEIFAEFSGNLSEVTAVAGGLVGTNERLARIVDPEALEVSFRLSTTQYARLLDDAGRLLPSPVTIALDVLGAEITTTGQLARVSAEVGEGQTGRLIHATLDQARGFRPGDFVTVRISEPMLEGVSLLPASAVDAAGGVLVLGAEDRLEPATVKVLRRQGNDVIIEAAAVAGREVVRERSPLLGAGIKVRPIRPGAADAPAAPEEPALVALDPERRARLIAFVEGNQRMPKEARDRVLAQLAQDLVPASVVERIEERMGG